ncbi:hypothetical protein [Streptomyces sp. SudanB52_2052]|uniref:hypothetical protein n=1 Tax=Streptomyces sp. SudanB52_2052 TaxID=3035276 RepID=UPI003F556BB5
MTTNTPATPRRNTGAVTAPRRPEPARPYESTPYEPAPAEPGLFTPRVRGRHRKPRPRKVLLAAGGLALAAGALSLVRLASGPSTDSVGTVEAEPRPDPVPTGADEAADTAASFPAAGPEASPSSPTALGGLTPSPATRGPAASRAPATTTDARGTDGVPRAVAPGATTVPDRPNAPAPAPTADTPRPAPTAPPSGAAPAPAPEPDEPRKPPKKPQDPGLCVPVIGLCVDTPGDRD